MKLHRLKSNGLKQGYGYTLIELLIVISITALLSTIVTVSFLRLRTNQQIRSAANDLISKIRQVQNYVLSGQIISGTTVADSYDLVFSANSQTYEVDYIVRTGANTTATTTLETDNLPQDIKINQLTLVSGNGSNSNPSTIRARVNSPFGKITANGAPNQTIELGLVHQKTNETVLVIIDGISGRISSQ